MDDDMHLDDDEEEDGYVGEDDSDDPLDDRDRDDDLEADLDSEGEGEVCAAGAQRKALADLSRLDSGSNPERVDRARRPFILLEYRRWRRSTSARVTLMATLSMRSAVEVAVGLQCVCVMRCAVLTTAHGHGNGSRIGTTKANVPLAPFAITSVRSPRVWSVMATS